MIITFKRPMIMTKKSLDVYQHNGKIGSMRYWRQGTSRNAKFDVNITMSGSGQTYEINQQSASIRKGIQWDILGNGNVIANMSTGKGVLAKDGVHFQFLDEETALTMEAKAWKAEGDLFRDREQIGKTKARGWFFRSYYEMDVSDSHVTMDPLLLAGVAYAFWATSNQR